MHKAKKWMVLFFYLPFSNIHASGMPPIHFSNSEIIIFFWGLFTFFTLLCYAAGKILIYLFDSKYTWTLLKSCLTTIFLFFIYLIIGHFIKWYGI